MVGTSIPVDPDAQTAQQWLTDELTNPAYHDGPSLLERFVTWFFGLFTDLSVAGLPGLWSALVVLAAVLAVLAVVFFVAGPVRASRRPAAGQGVLADDVRTADQLVAAASAAAAHGDLTAATLDAFRALVRRSEERVLLDPRPGRTAHEAALELLPRFPGFAELLSEAASVFDSLFYGTARGDARSYESMVELERAVRTQRPSSTPEKRVLIS